jgi:hypothetical protein
MHGQGRRDRGTCKGPSLGKDMQALANWCFKTTKCFKKDFATSL